MTVYILQHTHDLGEDGESAKMLGVYSSKVEADRAVTRFRGRPGFRDAPDGFSIDEYRVDEDHWVEGYATVG